jgi:hypothetical protein
MHALDSKLESYTLFQIEIAWAAAGQQPQNPRSRSTSAAATRRVLREGRSNSPARGSRPSSAEIPIPMRSKSLQLLTMAPKAFMQQQQQHQQQQKP